MTDQSTSYDPATDNECLNIMFKHIRSIQPCEEESGRIYIYSTVPLNALIAYEGLKVSSKVDAMLPYLVGAKFTYKDHFWTVVQCAYDDDPFSRNVFFKLICEQDSDHSVKRQKTVDRLRELVAEITDLIQKL